MQTDNTTMSFRTKKSVKEEIDSLAQQMGITPSDWLRTVAMQALYSATEGPTAVVTSNATPDHYMQAFFEATRQLQRLEELQRSLLNVLLYAITSAEDGFLSLKHRPEHGTMKISDGDLELLKTLHQLRSIGKTP